MKYTKEKDGVAQCKVSQLLHILLLLPSLSAEDQTKQYKTNLQELCSKDWKEGQGVFLSSLLSVLVTWGFILQSKWALRPALFIYFFASYNYQAY